MVGEQVAHRRKRRPVIRKGGHVFASAVNSGAIASVLFAPVEIRERLLASRLLPHFR